MMEKQTNKIVVNGKFLTQRQTGVQRYAREILYELDEFAQNDEIILAVPDGINITIPLFRNIKIERVSPFHGILWEQFSLPLYVFKKRAMCLSLCNVAPLLTPGFSTIHDVKIVKHPSFYSRAFRLWYKILFYNQTKRCEAIFTVSEDSRKDILNIYSFLNNQDVVVTYDSWDHIKRTKCFEGSLQKYNLESKQYCLSMGSLEPNKNFKWVAEVAQRNPDYIFAVAGSINEKIFADGLGFTCPPNMKFLGYVSDEEAKMLMRNAAAFIFPSFYEGFGLPPLEAISAGCPRVIVSAIPVMYEIFEENAIYIDPHKYDYSINEMLANSICDANKVLNKFSWGKSAKILYETVKNINRSNNFNL